MPLNLPLSLILADEAASPHGRGAAPPSQRRSYLLGMAA